MNTYKTENISFFISRCLRKLSVSEKIQTNFNKRRHKNIEKKLDPIFQSSLRKVNRNDQEYSNHGPIWIFWWQGHEKMPPLVRACYDSVIKNRIKREVILITKDNYMKYTDISDNIINLLHEKKITLTHFSDILRFNLLKNNGGLWLDATIFVTKPISENYFQKVFTCSGYENKDYFFVTQGNWCGFLIGGAKNSILFDFMDVFFREYWNQNDKLIDYFLIDYALNFAWKNNLSNFQEFTKKNIRKNNPNLFKLAPILNQKFNENDWNEINQETGMYKLTYKRTLSSDKNTFYNTLIKKGGIK